MHAAIRGGPSALALLTACIFALHADADAGSDIGARVEAIWLIQSVEFHYSSSNVAYACDELRGKIAAILASVGAHEGSIVRVGCNGTPLGAAGTHIWLASPVEATLENVHTATTFDGRAELVARMRAVPLPTAASIERFPATWRKVSFGRHGRLRIDESDCELLRAVIRRVFPRMSIRVSGVPLCVDGRTRGMPREVVALVRDSTVRESRLGPTPAAGTNGRLYLGGRRANICRV